MGHCAIFNVGLFAENRCVKNINRSLFEVNVIEENHGLRLFKANVLEGNHNHGLFVATTLLVIIVEKLAELNKSIAHPPCLPLFWLE